MSEPAADHSPVPPAATGPAATGPAAGAPTMEPTIAPTTVPDNGASPIVEMEDVMDALSNVIDPELGLDFVELGLVYGVEVNAGDVHITFTLTTPACPIGPQVTEQMEEFVGELEGVTSVECEMVFVPPWSPERMSEDAKFALGF
ncbi:MAG TPA: metal-sulfur cluster assembly factor [Solirubrobacteraceae bacterium]|jgi:metal-sulfur cluster biosynthetic enzyme|nr:metal-sulfur cluster assembly factor [Solirubrobacteraceae bacterium]